MLLCALSPTPLVSGGQVGILECLGSPVPFLTRLLPLHFSCRPWSGGTEGTPASARSSTHVIHVPLHPPRWRKTQEVRGALVSRRAVVRQQPYRVWLAVKAVDSREDKVSSPVCTIAEAFVMETLAGRACGHSVLLLTKAQQAE